MGRDEMNRLLIMLSAICVFCLGFYHVSAAQTRTMNSNSPGLLRSWPVFDEWQVFLVRTIDNRLACLILTGRKSDSGQYLFGFENDTQNFYIFLGDQDPDTVSGNSMRVFIDNTLIGTYQIDKRHSVATISSIRAIVPSSQAARLLGLLKVGENVQFVTDAATYSASLDGMTDALADVQNCLAESQALAINN